MSRSKDKGTAAETAVVAYLRANGFPLAERRALSGVLDKGDVSGVPRTVIEVKNASRDEMPGWLDEMLKERVNAGAIWGAVWAKRRGRASPGDWFVVMTGEQWVEILHRLGYGDKDA